jgi:hypothetical protein
LAGQATVDTLGFQVGKTERLIRAEKENLNERSRRVENTASTNTVSCHGDRRAVLAKSISAR